MPVFSFRALLLFVLAMSSPIAFAQPGSTSTTSDSTRPVSSSPMLSYQSAFVNYRAYLEQPVESWLAANRKVDDIGGWRAYAKEVTDPVAAEPTAGDQGDKP